MISTKTVVELDLVGYSDLARILDENLGAKIVAEYHTQIQDFVNRGLAEIGALRKQIVLATTGDGAILAFSSPSDAHRFTVALHQAAEEHNNGRRESAHRWFRAGLATGELYQRDGGEVVGQEIAGIVIVNAVRLEAAAKPGEFLADIATFALLPPELQQFYGSEEIIAGKRQERIAARRCTVVPHGTIDNALPTVLSLLDLFDQLNPRDQLNTIMLLIGMPTRFRPPDALPVFRRQEGIVEWVTGSGGCGLAKLEGTLKHLIQKQRVQSELSN